MSSRAIWLATLAVGLPCSYLAIVLLLGTEVLGTPLRVRHLLPILVCVFLVAGWSLGQLHARQLVSGRALAAISVSAPAVVLAIVAVDTVVAVETALRCHVHEFPRSRDPVRSLAASFPPKYYPTERNFRVFKPNVEMRAEVYGPAYKPPFWEQPTVIVESVLEGKSIGYSIDEHGFRDGTRPQDARVFALGDGLTEGSFSRLEDHWVVQLERLTGEPIYNLGIGGSSPKQQLMLLEHLIDARPGVFGVEHLLWMINESGDLEGSYQTFHGIPDSSGDPLEVTLVGALSSLAEAVANVVATVQSQSILHRWVHVGEAGEPPRGDCRDDPHWVVDGVRLVRPLYHSERYGYKAFDPVLLAVAAEGEDYVLGHPNRPLLDETFEEMRSLAERVGFRVTVLIAPNDVRLYAPYFEDFPRISVEPHFIDYVEDLARRLGFEVLNLYPPMRPHAAEELLNWRDDTHWNPRGERVVAEIIAAGGGR